jgi:hypothetical protein
VVSGLRSVVGKRFENQNARVNQTSFSVVRLRAFLPFAFCFVICAFFVASAQKNSIAPAPAPADASFKYKFENARFYISVIEIDLSAGGTGELRFKRGESDEIIDRNIKLLPATIARIRQLYDITNFIDSSEEYQDKKDFSHLGWISLSAQHGKRERKARFNYTTNKDISELAEIYRAIATQEMHLFDIETSERYQPLDLPRLLDTLENDLNLRRVAEPEQLLAMLREISGNDTQPLIARNHATRMIDSIKKGKFKSPMRK